MPSGVVYLRRTTPRDVARRRLESWIRNEKLKTEFRLIGPGLTESWVDVKGNMIDSTVESLSVDCVLKI